LHQDLTAMPRDGAVTLADVREPHVLKKLRARLGERNSDVILRLAAVRHESLNGS
jgi:hypothetical protein